MATTSDYLAKPIISPARAPAVLELPVLDPTLLSVPDNDNGMINPFMFSRVPVVGAFWLRVDASPEYFPKVILLQ